MSQQQSLNAFFNVRKRPVDQHASKRRKVLLDDATTSSVATVEKAKVKTLDSEKSHPKQLTNVKESSPEPCSPVVTSVFDDHRAHPVVATPKSVTSDPVNKRQHKRDVHGHDLSESGHKEEKVLFTVGRNPSTVRKRLDMSDNDNESSNIRKHLTMTTESAKIEDSSSKVVSFVKLGNLSPVKNVSLKNSQDLKEIKNQAGKILQGLKASGVSEAGKLTPQEIKTRLGTVTKLSDLQARLKTLNSAPSHKRELFPAPKSGPKLTQESVTLDIVKENKPKPPPSPIKASPRKSVLEGPILANLPQPDNRLPLPRKYKFLAEVFDIVDQIVSMKHNRREIIRVVDVKPAVQNVLRKSFNESYLKQIRCVFPKAYIYTWERIRDRMGRDTNNFDLHMEVNLEYDESNLNNGGEEKKKVFKNLTPAAKVERVKVFKHNLLTIVEDHHREFLREIGINVKAAAVMAWHPEFDLETLPDVDQVEFPAKPQVDKVTTAQEMIQRLGTGVNPRLETVLKQQATAAALAKPEPDNQPKVGDVKILKGLQGLSPQLLEMLKAREKAKQIKNMTQTSQEQKELEMMEELLEIAPYIVNCHRSQRNGAAVPSEMLFKVTSDSYGRKTPKEMEQLVRMFIKLVPECMEVKSYEKVEYIKQKKPSPDINQIRSKLEKLVEQKKNSF